MRSAVLAPVAALVLLPSLAGAAPCAGNPEALGTDRVLEVDTAAIPRVGLIQFRQTLSLAPKEVVLTFDDGPWPTSTPRVLDALKRECVRATFFLLGRNATSFAALVRRESAEGHTVAHHTYAHPLLNRMRMAAAEAEIDRGIAAVQTALTGHSSGVPTTPFFRFPGFASSPALLDRLAARRITVFGADLWASDWNRMQGDQELRLVLRRLEARGRGIILFHDTKMQTAAMLPAFLRELKRRGYRIVHVVAAPAPNAVRP